MRAAERCLLRRSRQELSKKIHHSNDYLVPKVGLDTAENEPSEVYSLSACRSRRLLRPALGFPSFQHGLPRCGKAFFQDCITHFSIEHAKTFLILKNVFFDLNILLYAIT